MPHSFNQVQDILTHYHLDYQVAEFLDFNPLPTVPVAETFKSDLRFAIANRGNQTKRLLLVNLSLSRFSEKFGKGIHALVSSVI